MRDDDASQDFDVVIVGAGISGIGTAIELLRHGYKSFVMLEAHPDCPGGTWRDNTYPGVAIDIMAVSYCFSYETDYPWSRQYAPGAEILGYIRHCIDKYGLEPYIRYGSRVECCKLEPEGDVRSLSCIEIVKFSTGDSRSSCFSCTCKQNPNSATR